ncbi:hypothetical protein ECC35_04075 [Helicobacter pylori]|nr:hypothetical protein [Helicobacter pylori]RVY52555.1 hypothetical protein ECC35_04075 [Helicobacter pylori]
MDNNKNNNKNASHLTHEMKKTHGDLQTASMKALITQKVDELNDIRKKQLAEKEIQAEIEEESRKKERESFKRERKSLE